MNTKVGANWGQAEPLFVMDKVYLKAVEFASPESPGIFFREVQPKLDVNVDVSYDAVQQDVYEVVLKVMAKSFMQEAEKDEKTILFDASITYAGVFRMAHQSKEDGELLLNVRSPEALFPFAREELATLVAKFGFPQLLLAPVDFGATYYMKIKKEVEDKKRLKEKGADT